MDTRNKMLRLIRSRRAGFGLHQPFYVDPDFFKIDLGQAVGPPSRFRIEDAGQHRVTRARLQRGDVTYMTTGDRAASSTAIEVKA